MNGPVDDVDRVMAVMKSAFDPAYGEAWSRRQVEDALLIGNCHYYLVDPEGQSITPGAVVAGFSLSRRTLDEQELLLLAVEPKYRRQGIGHALLNELVQSAKRRGVRRLMLEMRHGNPAESLYRTFGFHPVGKRPDYYRMPHGERIDAITFALMID